MWDEAAGRLRLIDLDLYRRGPFRNEMGRMFGSTRFMAPEEFERGALIDERTTVFNLGRAAATLMGDGSLEESAFEGCAAQFAIVQRACRPDPGERFQSVEDLASAWRATLRPPEAEVGAFGCGDRFGTGCA